MQHLLLALTSVVVGIAGIPAQSYVYSPARAATSGPWYRTHIPFHYDPYLRSGTEFGRYQQVHNDLTGAQRLLTGVGFRHGDIGPTRGSRGGVLDGRILMSYGDARTVSTTFAANYASTPVDVFRRKRVSMPDQQLNRPWALTFPFDAPFLYNGSQDLLWELQTYEYQVTDPNRGTCLLDVAVVENFGIATSYGVPCRAPGQTADLDTRTTVFLRRSTNTMIFSALFENSRPSVPGGIAFGVGRQATVVPGWCAALYVNPLVYHLGTSDSFGRFGTPFLEIPFQPALGGMRIHWQGFTTRPVLLTSGVEVLTPVAKPGPVVRRVYGESHASTRGRTDYYGDASLATRFEY